MLHAFMLVVLLAEVKQPNPMYFRSIDVCQYYASRVPRQYGNYNYSSRVDPKDRITAYCKPTKVDDSKTVVYDH